MWVKDPITESFSKPAFRKGKKKGRKKGIKSENEGKGSQYDGEDEKVWEFLKDRRERERERGTVKKHSSPFLGPLQEGMAPICPTLTFERISDYTGERGRQRWAKRESSTGVCGTVRMIHHSYNNEESRVKNNRAPGERGRYGTAGLRLWLSF